MSTGVEIKCVEANLQFGPSNSGSKKLRSFPYSNYQNLLLDPSKLSYKIDSMETGSSVIEVDGEHEQNPIATQNGPCSEAPEAGPGSLIPENQLVAIWTLNPLQHVLNVKCTASSLLWCTMEPVRVGTTLFTER